MQDNSFESKMQQKMDGLHIAPSDAVWQQVEHTLHKEKDRRWLLLLLLIPVLLSVIGYWAYNYGKTNKVELAKQTVADSLKPENKITSEILKPSDTVIHSKTEHKDQLIQQRKNITTINNTVRKPGNIKKDLTEMEIFADDKVDNNIAGMYTKSKLKSVLKRRAKLNATINSATVADKAGDEKEKAIDTPNVATNKPAIVAEQPVEAAATLKPDSAVVAIVVSKPVSDSKSNAPVLVKRKNENTAKRKWILGFEIDASKVWQDAGILESNAKSLTASPFSSGSGSVAMDTSLNLSPRSKIFGAGLILNRQLNNRLSFNTGLLYKFYAYRIINNISTYNLSTSGNYNLGNSMWHEDAIEAHGFSVPVGITYDFFHGKNSKISLNAAFQNNFAFIDKSLGNIAFLNRKGFNPFYNSYQPMLSISPSYALGIGNGRVRAALNFGYGLRSLYKANSTYHLYSGGLSIIYMPGKIFGRRQ